MCLHQQCHLWWLDVGPYPHRELWQHTSLEISLMGPSMVDHAIYCDTCPEGMGFWYPVLKDGYYTPVNVPSDVIFYFKALCILSAIVNVQAKAHWRVKILIYTDNMNSIDIFCSLCCLPQHNHLFKQAIDVLIWHDLSLHVLHVTGDQNIVANALSRVQFWLHLALNLNSNSTHSIPLVWWGQQHDLQHTTF